jgi:hypothetical protein
MYLYLKVKSLAYLNNLRERKIAKISLNINLDIVVRIENNK